MALLSTLRFCTTLGAALVSACSAAPSGETASGDALTVEAESDPPGAALPLSIGGRLDSEEDNPASTAANCAAALKVTSNRVARVSGDRTASEVALMNRAEDYFASQADAPSAITSLVDSNDVAGQAQLAIACLRRFANRGASTIPPKAF
ncbi:MAG: hypothetical protein AAF251_11000 [Pseudomonadota bacterium]